MVLHWYTTPFQALYDAIERNDESLKQELVLELSEDLTLLLIKKEKSDASRKTLETGEVKFADGSIFKVNKYFIENAIQVADQLNLDEINAAELLYFATSKEQNELGTSYIESAIAAFFNRSILLLQIVSYYFCSDTLHASNQQSNDLMKNDSVLYSPDKKTVIDSISKFQKFSTSTILKSFITIEKDLELLKEQVERSKLLGAYHPHSKEMKSINYKRSLSFKQYQLLGEVLFGYVATVGCSNDRFTVDEFAQILDHLGTFDPEDTFSVSFLPALFFYTSSVQVLPQKDVELLHAKAIKSIADVDKLSETPIKALIWLTFLTYFIDWCKIEPGRTKKYEFTVAVEKPMQTCIQVGALEQLLCICADTSTIQTELNNDIKPFYDFRSFLQQHIPKLLPIKLLDVDNEATAGQKSSLEQQMQMILINQNSLTSIYTTNEYMKLDNHYVEFIVLAISNFIHTFVSTAAFLMTQLRDAEEDLLISSETFDLENLTENADLERLYLAIYYLYSGREQYISKIWGDPNTPFYGFLQWASKCNSPLIMSTFSMLLSGLAYGSDNAISVFSFLQMTNSNTALLTNPKHNSTLLTKYPSISWSTIYSTLNYYCEELTNASDTTLQTLSSAPLDVDLKSKGKVITELGEDSIIYISGFFQVLSEVARNSEKARVDLLESDNGQLLNILTKLLNMNTLLNGSVLTLLGSLVGDSLADRTKFWQILDSWIFNNGRSSSVVNFPKAALTRKLVNYQHICGFVSLLKKLLDNLDSSSDIFHPLSLPFPLDLGGAVRKPGIWCYLDFLCTDIFPDIDYTEIPMDDKISLKFDILNLLKACVGHLDPEIVVNSSICGVKNLDGIVEMKSIIRYFQAHPASAILTCFFKNKFMESLFDVCEIEIEEIYQASFQSPRILLVQKSLELFNEIMKYENFFFDQLVPILRLPDNQFTDPTSINISGPISLCQCFLLNLPLLANITLFVGSDKLDMAALSLTLLSKIYSSKEFCGMNSNLQSSLVKKNKFLVMCETIDESIRIRAAFIQQLNSEITEQKSVFIKLSLLQFINDNLDPMENCLSVSHFLLGFDTKRMDCGSENVETTILSRRSLLKSIVLILKETLPLFSKNQNLEYSPVKLCSLAMEILFKLCKSDITRKMVIDFLHNGLSRTEGGSDRLNFILCFAENLSVLNPSTKFAGYSFNGNISTQNKFSTDGGLDTLNALISLKGYFLQLLAIEMHNVVSTGELSLLSKYKSLLIDSMNYFVGSSKLLAILDILDYKAENRIEKVDPIFEIFRFEYIFKKIGLVDQYQDTHPFVLYNMEVIDKLITLIVKSDTNMRSVNKDLLDQKKTQLKKIIRCSIALDKFKSTVLNYINSWCLLVQVIVDDVDMPTNKKKNLVYDILQSIIPLIDEYLVIDAAFVEPLVSLCVRLFNLKTYKKDAISLNAQSQLIIESERLFPIFRVFFTGITKTSSIPSLRSDFYILARTFIDQAILNQNILTDLTIFMSSSDPKIFDIIRHDALVGENSNCITSLMLLESFLKLFSQSRYLNDGFIFDKLCNENFVRLLIQQLKKLDKILLSSSNNTDSLVWQRIFYELTSIKTSINLLTRVAQTRTGAQLLLSSGLFNTVKSCRVLCVDTVFELQNAVHPFSSERLVLLGNLLPASRSLSSPETFSYYELLIPIFRLLTTLIISLGPQNKECMSQANEIAQHFHNLFKNVMKREAVYEQHQQKVVNSDNTDSICPLEELSKLVTLLYSLIY